MVACVVVASPRPRAAAVRRWRKRKKKPGSDFLFGALWAGCCGDQKWEWGVCGAEQVMCEGWAGARAPATPRRVWRASPASSLQQCVCKRVAAQRARRRKKSSRVVVCRAGRGRARREPPRAPLSPPRHRRAPALTPVSGHSRPDDTPAREWRVATRTHLAESRTARVGSCSHRRPSSDHETPRDLEVERRPSRLESSRCSLDYLREREETRAMSSG